MIKALFWILITYLLLSLLAFLGSYFFLFQPPKRAEGLKPLPFQKNLPTAYGKIAIVDLPSPNTKYTILYSHGNAEDLYSLYPFLKKLQSANYRVVSYDYNGYGKSQGNPSEEAIYTDINTVYRYLIQQNVQPKEIIIMGHSLGSGPSVYLAAHHQNAAIILFSPFSSAYRSQLNFNWPLFLGDSFNNASLIGKIHIPLLILHAPNDRVINYNNSKYLYKLANNPKKLIALNLAGDGHNISWNEIELALHWLKNQLKNNQLNMSFISNTPTITKK